MVRRPAVRSIGRSLGVLAAVLLLTAAPVTIDAALAAPVAPSAVVIFGGHEFAAVPGLVLGQGQADTAGVCAGVEHSIRITAPRTIGYADVGVGVTNDCTLFVESVRAELNGPSQVQQFTGGDFENQGGSLRYHLGAHPNAWIGGNGVFCDAVGSTMPFGWHDHCEYGRFW